MPTLKFTHKWNKGDILTPPSTPGYFVQVRDVVVKDNQVQYEVDEIGSMNSLMIPAERLEQFFRKPTRAEAKLVDELINPPEPEDPNFDKNGFPIYRPPHI